MTPTPVLSLPNFNKQFTIQTDASGFGMGAVLTREGHLISYFSKTFCPKLLNSSTYVRKLHAITVSVQEWHHYLLGKEFIIKQTNGV